MRIFHKSSYDLIVKSGIVRHLSVCGGDLGVGDGDHVVGVPGCGQDVVPCDAGGEQ